MKIYNQGQYPECKGYSFLTALTILNPNVDSEKVIRIINEDYSGLLTNRGAGEFFKKNGLIKDYKSIGKSILLKGRLNRGIPIISTVYGVDWKATNKPPFIAKFIDRVGAHSVCAVGYDNKTRLIKVANTWGESWGDKGCYYIHANDIVRLGQFCEITPI